MKKALINASVASMIYKFNLDNINILQEMGYRVDVACNFDYEINPISKEQVEDCKKQLTDRGCHIFDIDCPRSVNSIGALYSTYKQLKEIAKGKYDLVHTQSPVGGVLCRLAFKKARRKYGTRVIYQAHGFHFYDGAPKINWMIYYPIERLCGKITDTLLTINLEDFNRAKKKKICENVIYVPGIGLDTEKFKKDELTRTQKKELRKSIGIPTDAFLMFSVGELNENKNHQIIIRALADIDNDKVFYVIAGCGEGEKKLVEVVHQLDLSRRVKLIGFRTDVKDLYHIADAFVLPSLREGLNVSLMEAMCSGLPCLVSKIRGNVDLIDEKGGYVFEPTDIEECKNAISKLISTNSCKKFGKYNQLKIDNFGKRHITEIMKDVYKSE